MTPHLSFSTTALYIIFYFINIISILWLNIWVILVLAIENIAAVNILIQEWAKVGLQWLIWKIVKE